MKLFNFLLTVLSSPRGSIGEADATDVSSDSTPDVELSDDATSDQPETESSASLEDQLNALEVDEFDGDAFLSSVKSLGVTRNGLPADFKDTDEVRDLISKGYDYTKKTQEFAEERKAQEAAFQEQTQAFETQRQEFEQERSQFQEQLTRNEILESLLVSELQTNYPDIFEELDASFTAQLNQYQRSLNNPVLNQFNEKVSHLESQLSKFEEKATEKQHSEIREGFQTESAALQQKLGAKLSKLGITPNWNEVKETWAADLTGKMTVEQAFYAKHGVDIQKALDSHNNLTKTKLMSDRRTGGATRQSEAGEKVDKSSLSQNERFNRLRERLSL